MKDAGIKSTEGFTQRLNSYQSQKSHYDEDPLGAAYADPEAVKWDRLVKGTLGESDNKARQMVLM
ncbi:hypothetical protein [Pseudovibrio sp. Ad37]|uniref:hypothetical protein n=1 Tax=Pseudovibrio sp. Ad37 TaxID=989422 RepID=UPI000A606BDE|nr:hypothetical protein [Pseudovibrio sp. Ad37]